MPTALGKYYLAKTSQTHKTMPFVPFSWRTARTTARFSAVPFPFRENRAVENRRGCQCIDCILDMEPDNRAFAQLQSQVLCPVCWATVRDKALNCGHTYYEACASRLVDCATHASASFRSRAFTFERVSPSSTSLFVFDLPCKA